MLDQGRPGAGRSFELCRIINGCGEAERSDNSHTRNRHQPSDDLVLPRYQANLRLEMTDLLKDVGTCPHQCFHDSLDCWRRIELAIDDFLGTLDEPTNPFAKQDTKGAKDTSDLVFQVAAGSHKFGYEWQGVPELRGLPLT